ncbi:MAG: hypothetical protein KKB82_08665 [Candidatus Omnitrophica bacterium]|nr:hypothetical protein [Candidatus Omnitrophota bacterium]MBU1925973.1 hypothetical protein [Candidatus Omnitrophota bacterium]
MNYLKRNRQIIACCFLALASGWALPPYLLADIQTAALAPKIELGNESMRTMFYTQRSSAPIPYLAEKEWQTAGNPRLFPKTLFEIDFLREQAQTKIPAAIEALNNHYKKSIPVIGEGHLDYFFDFFSYTAMFTDCYQVSYSRVLDDLISGDNKLLLAMFRTALKHYSFRRAGSLSYFYRFPSLEKEFIAKVETILAEKAKTKDNTVTILVLGSALGEEAITLAWLLRKNITSSAAFSGFNFKIIGIEKNEAVFYAATSKLETGYNLLTGLGDIYIDAENAPLTNKRIAIMSEVNNNLAEYAKSVRFELANIPVSAEFPKLLEAADLVVSNTLWIYLDRFKRSRLLAAFEQRMRANKPLYIIGTDADMPGFVLKPSSGEAQANKSTLRYFGASSSLAKTPVISRATLLLQQAI